MTTTESGKEFNLESTIVEDVLNRAMGHGKSCGQIYKYTICKFTHNNISCNISPYNYLLVFIVLVVLNHECFFFII